ncbi:unnamed protein product [Amoebophrya sp. A120]|nr:unnamed protein product [Amoebophrya sp. A120]|eukprot:GSA120T00012367001.1
MQHDTTLSLEARMTAAMNEGSADANMGGAAAPGTTTHVAGNSNAINNNQQDPTGAQQHQQSSQQQLSALPIPSMQAGPGTMGIMPIMQPQLSMIPSVAPNQPMVSLWTATWARESHGLFDYEARHPIKKHFQVATPLTICRKGTEVTTVNGTTQESEPLARLVVRNGAFCVDAARVGDGRVKSGKLWRVVKDLEHGYNLQEGDSIKLGRFKLRVRQIVTGDPNSPNNPPECANVNPPSLPPRPCDTSEEAIKELEQTTCRICLLEGSSVEDPLIKPCECRGTIEYVHLACLRHWVRGKLDLAESSSGTYFYKPMACELCKTQYATHLQDKADAKNCFPLIELPKTTPPFIVLERDSNRPELKGVHVISLAEKKLLKLGRGHESDVRFADVSISRWHASVHYDGEKNAFVLTDHGSKFGTLVAMKTPVPLESTQGLSLQAGRTVLHFTLNNNLGGNAGAQQLQQLGLQSFGNIVNVQHEADSTSQSNPVEQPASNIDMQPVSSAGNQSVSAGGANNSGSGMQATLSNFPMFQNAAGQFPLIGNLLGNQQHQGQIMGMGTPGSQPVQPGSGGPPMNFGIQQNMMGQSPGWGPPANLPGHQQMGQPSFFQHQPTMFGSSSQPGAAPGNQQSSGVVQQPGTSGQQGMNSNPSGGAPPGGVIPQNNAVEDHDALLALRLSLLSHNSAAYHLQHNVGQNAQQNQQQHAMMAPAAAGSNNNAGGSNNAGSQTQNANSNQQNSNQNQTQFFQQSPMEGQTNQESGEDHPMTSFDS